MDVDVAIIGGGLAGLFTASELVHRGVGDIVVTEQTDRPGGVARTIHVDGYSLEPAAGTLMLPHPHLSPILDRVGATVIAAEAVAARRYVHTRGRLVAIPASPKAAFAPLVGWGAKFRAAAEPLIRSRAESDDETVAEFLERRLGPGLGSMVAWLAASGVFAGDPDRLSARAAFPAIPALEDAAGSIIRGGIRRLRARDRSMPRPTSHVVLPDMAALAESAAASLGGRFRGGFEATAVERDGDRWLVEGPETIRARRVVLACRPQRAATLLGGSIAPVLDQAVTAPVAVVWLGGRSTDMPLPEGFGALMGRDAGSHVLGALFESSYAPRRAPGGRALCKIIMGGATRPEVAEWDTDRLVSVAVEETSSALGRSLRPSLTHVVRHAVGIPQYEVGHLAWLERLREMTPRGIHFTGWGYRGVGVAHLATDAVRTAASAADR